MQVAGSTPVSPFWAVAQRLERIHVKDEVCKTFKALSQSLHQDMRHRYTLLSPLSYDP